MNVLLIDTSAKEVAVQVIGDKSVLVVDQVNAGSTSSRMLPTVKEALAQAGIAQKDLDVVAAVSGPGSFTGLRIGVSFANGLAYGLGAKRLAVPALKAIRGESGLLAAMPSRQGYSYTLGQEYGEMNVEQVGSQPSVGLAGSGATRVLTSKEYYELCREYVLAHFADASDRPVEPMYLKKCQAERERESKA